MSDGIVRMLGRNATLVIATANLVAGGWRIEPTHHADAYKGKLDALGYKAARSMLMDLGARRIDTFTAAELREWDAREARYNATH